MSLLPPDPVAFDPPPRLQEEASSMTVKIAPTIFQRLVMYCSPLRLIPASRTTRPRTLGRAQARRLCQLINLGYVQAQQTLAKSPDFVVWRHLVGRADTALAARQVEDPQAHLFPDGALPLSDVVAKAKNIRIGAGHVSKISGIE